MLEHNFTHINLTIGPIYVSLLLPFLCISTICGFVEGVKFLLCALNSHTTVNPCTAGLPEASQTML